MNPAAATSTFNYRRDTLLSPGGEDCARWFTMEEKEYVLPAQEVAFSGRSHMLPHVLDLDRELERGGSAAGRRWPRQLPSLRMAMNPLLSGG